MQFLKTLMTLYLINPVKSALNQLAQSEPVGDNIRSGLIWFNSKDSSFSHRQAGLMLIMTENFHAAVW